jgi:ureidoacrylate peracid hydrolase
MPAARYIRSRTAVVLVDPYNDFFSRLGRAWPMTRDVALANRVVSNIVRLLSACRSAGVHVAYAPHYRHRRGGLSHRKHPAPSHLLVRTLAMFSANGRGGRFHAQLAPAPGDTVATEHETSCGFTGTDLDDRLREHGIEDVVLCGALSNTCVEATGRTARDLGYRVTFLRDGVTAQSRRDHRAALANYPELGRSLTVLEFIAAIEP